jgi:hypothetical protein
MTTASDQEDFDLSNLWQWIADTYADVELSWRRIFSAEEGRGQQIGPYEKGQPEFSVYAYGAVSATLAAAAIGSHLSVLSRAYWPGRRDTDYTPVDQMAIDPPARAAIEAAGIVCWIFDETISNEEQLIRSSELWIWSTSNNPEKRHLDDAVASIDSAGLTVRRKGRNTFLVSAGTARPRLTITRLVVSMFGEMGRSLYQVWSSSAHSDPAAMYTIAREADEVERTGWVALEFAVDPLYHLLTLGVVVDAVSAAGTCFANDNGVDASVVHHQCTEARLEIVRRMKEYDPTLATATEADSQRSEPHV